MSKRLSERTLAAYIFKRLTELSGLLEIPGHPCEYIWAAKKKELEDLRHEFLELQEVSEPPTQAVPAGVGYEAPIAGIAKMIHDKNKGIQ